MTQSERTQIIATDRMHQAIRDMRFLARMTAQWEGYASHIGTRSGRQVYLDRAAEYDASAKSKYLEAIAWANR